MTKKILLTIMMLVTILVLVIGCAQKTATPPSSTPAPATPSQPTKTYEWKMECFQPPVDKEFTYAWPYFAELVEKNTNGQVKITLYETGSIVTGPDLLNAVRDGILEAAVTSPSYHRGAIPVLNTLEGLPFSFQNVKELDEVLHEHGLCEVAREPLTQYGVHLVGCNAGAGDGLGVLAKPAFKTLDDLQGKIVRAQGAFLDFWELLGLKTVPIPFPEIYTSMTTGTIDACATAWTGMYSLKLYEMAKYAMKPFQIGSVTAMLIVNPDTWNELPENLQQIVTDTYNNEWNTWTVNEYEPTRMVIFDEYEKVGVEFVTLPQSDQDRMLDVAMQLWDEEAKIDPLCAEAVQILKDYYKGTGRIK